MSSAPWIYFVFFPPIDKAGLPAREFAVAETFGFSCLGFLASLLPRLLLPLAMVCPSKMQRSDAELARGGCGIHRLPIRGTRRISLRAQVELGSVSAASSNARCWPRETVVIGDRNSEFAAARSSAVSISVQFNPVTSSV